ncbi:2,3-bisphosphoglycerate-dependent phosphoglycerate mutase [Tanacetum coccineum]
MVDAVEAGKRIRIIPIGMMYTYALIHTQMTDMLAITQHRCKEGCFGHYEMPGCYEKFCGKHLRIVMEDSSRAAEAEW